MYLRIHVQYNANAVLQNAPVCAFHAKQSYYHTYATHSRALCA